MTEQQTTHAGGEMETVEPAGAMPLLKTMAALEEKVSAFLERCKPAAGSEQDIVPFWTALEKMNSELREGMQLVDQIHHFCTVANLLNRFIESFGPKAKTREEAQRILQRYLAALSRSGIVLTGGYSLTGEVFNPRLHQATATVPATKKLPPGTIVSAPVFGAKAGEHTVCYPQVIVADEYHQEQETQHEIN